MNGDRRRSPRTDVDLRVELRPDGAPEAVSFRALDVNENGLFLSTSAPLPMHTRVEISLAMGGGERFTASGRVVRILWPQRVAPGEPPGFGVQFEALAEQSRARWVDFCRQVAHHRTPTPERRRFERVPTRLVVHVRATSAEELQAFVTHNFSASGAAFETNTEMPLGLRLCLAVHHPQTDEVFHLEGEVARCERSAHGCLVGIRFDAPELKAFVRLTAALPV